MNRRAMLLGFGAIAVAAMAGNAAKAHHGWRWAEDKTTRLTGVIRSARLGNPHGVLVLDVRGALWTVEVGSPLRNARAGLADAMLARGATVTVTGHRSTDPAARRIRAVRVIVKGKPFDLYSDRN